MKRTIVVAVSLASEIPLASMPRASTTPSIVVRSSARMIVPSARPARTAKAPGKLAPLAVRCASIRWARVSRPVKPPGSDLKSPLACAPPASRAAIEIIVGRLFGSRIRPLLVNGPSREPPFVGKRHQH